MDHKSIKMVSRTIKISFRIRKYFISDRRLRSSSKTVITRRETGLVDSLCNAVLFDFSSSDDSANGNKRERPHSAGSSSKLTFPSKLPLLTAPGHTKFRK
jgi:hypothetical protein